MPQQLFTNQASTLLAADILAADVSLTVLAGEGVKFPTPSGGDWFTVTLQVGLNFEIVNVTGKVGDVFTIERGQDGTIAQDWATGATVGLRVHAQWLETVHTTSTVPTAMIGDVKGPASSVNDDIAVFDLATGKLIKDGGQTIPEVIAAGAAAAPQGDVVGPASAIDAHLAIYDLATGKLIKDGGQTIPEVIAAGAAAAPQGDVVGPASSVNAHLPLFSGTTGKIIGDSGLAVAAEVLTTQAYTASGSSALNWTMSAGSFPITLTTGQTFDLAPGSGLVVANWHENGNVGLYLCGGGNVVLASQIGTPFVAGVPAAGKIGLFFNGPGGNYRFQSQMATTITLGLVTLSSRPAA